MPDLFLRVKIEALARAAGRTLVAFTTAEGVVERLAAEASSGVAPGLVLVDLGAPRDEGFVLLERMAARPLAPPTLAYFSHVDEAAKKRAQSLGATRVVPRSALVARFDDLVTELAIAD